MHLARRRFAHSSTDSSRTSSREILQPPQPNLQEAQVHHDRTHHVNRINRQFSNFTLQGDHFDHLEMHIDVSPILVGICSYLPYPKASKSPNPDISIYPYSISVYLFALVFYGYAIYYMLYFMLPWVGVKSIQNVYMVLRTIFLIAGVMCLLLLVFANIYPETSW